MLVNFINLGGYGIFVWPAFFFTFLTCLSLYLKTKKELQKQEKKFAKEFDQSKIIEIEVDNRRKTKKEVLAVSSI